MAKVKKRKVGRPGVEDKVGSQTVNLRTSEVRKILKQFKTITESIREKVIK